MSFPLPQNSKKETNNSLRKAGASKRERNKITLLVKACCFAAVHILATFQSNAGDPVPGKKVLQTWNLMRVLFFSKVNEEPGENEGEKYYA